MGKYDRIINMEHHTSLNRKRMSLLDRAAQFAPFAALTGYDESIKETARLTDRRIELSDEEKEVISAKLGYIVANKVKESVEVIYFVPDKSKDGGSYNTYVGVVKRIDEVERKIHFIDKVVIRIDDVVSIDSEELSRVYRDWKE